MQRTCPTWVLMFRLTGDKQRQQLNESVTHTLSLTISDAGKLMMSEADMKGIN